MKNKNKNLKYYIILALIQVFLAALGTCLVVIFPDCAPAFSITFMLLVVVANCKFFDFAFKEEEK